MGVYKNSIWKGPDLRYEFDPASVTRAQKDLVSRLQTIDRAKKQSTLVPPKDLLKIAEAIKKMPRASKANEGDVIRYLQRTQRLRGAGIPTVICMLAVETEGDYSPIDRKFSAGLLAKRKVTAGERKCLEGSDAIQFAKVYISKVLPAWSHSRKTLSAVEADEFWGNAGPRQKK